MENIRIIPRLDIKGPNLVKGIHLEGLRVLGTPQEFAKYYYENGADELIFMDVVASLFERNSLQDIITKTAREIFIPLTVGGGLRTLDDIKEVLRAGADKVALNTAAVKDPNVVREAALEFGSSTIVVAVEAIKEPDGRYLAYIDSAREYTGVEVIEWVEQLESLGAGEIVLTSVDNEGTGIGYDVDLIRKVTDKVNIPVIAHGGPGKLEHLGDVIEKGKPNAVAIASMLHYEYVLNNRSEVDNKTEGNMEFLRSGKGFQKIEKVNIQEVKSYLFNRGIPCRFKQLTDNKA